MKARALLLLLPLAWAMPSWAYNDLATHPDLTRVAFDKSKLNTDPNLYKSLMLVPLSAGPRFPYDADYWWPQGLLARGAYLEDVYPLSLHHFYDPITHRPLTLPLIAIPFIDTPRASPTWALEDLEEYPNQSDSFRDARGSMYLALTSTGPELLRKFYWSETFYRLGHVLHHIQDMAQPQHVRDDDHLDMYPWAIGFFDPSLYESYTHNRRGHVFGLAASAQVQAVYPGLPELKAPRDFWVNAAHSGISEFTNQNFVSQDTNFRIYNNQILTGGYARPIPGAAVDYTVDQLYAGQGLSVPPHIAELCSGSTLNCTMTMYATQPAGYPTQLVTKASTLSIFDQDLQDLNLSVTYYDTTQAAYQISRLFVLNRFNFDEMHEKLIPKAVAYSAGFINYFFRGKLEVTRPAIGAYAIADHTPGQGFDEVKVKVKNVTPGEKMSDGTVVAVARFHRNECYRPDLSGEFMADGSGNPIPPSCAPGHFYSAEEFIVASAPQPLTLESGQEQEMMFSFTEPIPFDATDVYLQVIFRGTLGAEPERAVAVGAVDVSEPTFLSIMNATDVVVLPDGTPRGNFYYYRDIIAPANIVRPPYSLADTNGNRTYDPPGDYEIRGSDTRVEISLADQPVAEIPALPEGRFSRIAFLMDPAGLPMKFRISGRSMNGTLSFPADAKINQRRWENNTYTWSAVQKLRGVAYHWDSMAYSLSYASTHPELKTMPPSFANDAVAPWPMAYAQLPRSSARMEQEFAQEPRAESGAPGTVLIHSPPEVPRALSWQ